MKNIFFIFFLIMPFFALSQQYNGLDNNMGNLYKLSKAKSRSISPENFTGEKGTGHFVGTYLAWGINNNGWWGEGEFKFYLDGDSKFPTICGTGAEYYFCGSHDFASNDQYVAYSTPYAGLHQIIRSDGYKKSQQRFGMYRWHITDPIRFEKDLRITVQDMGWRYGGRYLPQTSDIASTVFWYQTEPHDPFPVYPSREELEVN